MVLHAYNICALSSEDQRYAISYISRKGWGAKPSKDDHGGLKPLRRHREFAVISHSAATGQCSTTDDCCNTVRTVQEIGFKRGAETNHFL